MTQVPNRPQRPSAVPVVPGDASTPDSPAAAHTASAARPFITPEARQFALDMAEAKRMPFGALVLHHARALSTLRAVWASRRGWQHCAEEFQDERDQLRGAIAAWQLHDRTQRARIAELEARLNQAGGAANE